MKALLIVATVADLALAALLIAVSGFIFGSGPEGMSGAWSAALGWSLAFIGCLAAPPVGFALYRRKRDGLGAFIAWLPPVIALIVSFAPFHPY